ncbi:MAG: hypothetical protein CMJ18_19970 [Phycisphaeraceae bacterium]|nr:hypothetical protein [Phycisphaeraceae bacterium]
MPRHPTAPPSHGLERLESRVLLSDVSGTVFNDFNRNGMQDEGEPAVPGIEVALFRTSSRTDRIAADQVLVIYNSANADSAAVFDHYSARRPGVRGFDLDDPDLLPGAVTYDTFIQRIRDPVRRHLDLVDPDRSIVVLTLTMGIPHRIRDLGQDPGLGERPGDAGEQFGLGNATYASVDSELTLLWHDLSTTPRGGELGGRMDSYADNFVVNPYFGQTIPITTHSRARIDDPFSFINRAQVHWTWRRNAIGARSADAGRIYLTSRLDGIGVDDVIAMINRAAEPVYEPGAHQVIIDRNVDGDDEGDYEATRDLLDAVWPAITFDESPNFLIGASNAVPDPNAVVREGPVAALVSYGGNHGNASQGNYLRTFTNQLVDGAIVSTLESFNAKSFGGLVGFLDHGQLSNWIDRGGTFGVGSAWEPFVDGRVRNEHLFDAFFRRGLTWVEAAWSAIPYVSSTHVVVGDPLSVATFSDPASTTATDGDGGYRFEDRLLEGHYLQFTLPDDFAFVEPEDEDGIDANGRTEVFVLGRKAGDERAIGLREIADPPTLQVADGAGDEDAPIALSIAAALTDDDGSEELAILIDDVPEGALLSAGTRREDGSWMLGGDELAGLSITPPPDADDDLSLTVPAVATEPNGGDTSETVRTLQISVLAVADAPVLEVTDAAGEIDSSVGLSIDAAPADSDGSEALTILIESVPVGAILSAGTPLDESRWSLQPADLAGLSLTPPPGRSDPFELDVTATATEAFGGDAQSISVLLPVVIHTVHEQDGAVEDETATIGHDQILPAAVAAGVGVSGDDVTFLVTKILQGMLTASGAPAVPGSTLLETGPSLAWQPPANENGTIEAFRVLADDGSTSATIQVEFIVAPVNDAPMLTGATAHPSIVGLGNALRIDAEGATDIDDAELRVRFHQDVNGNGLVDGADGLLAEAEGPGHSASIDNRLLGLGDHVLLADAVDDAGAVSAPIAIPVQVTEVQGGPSEQDAASTRPKVITAPFTPDPAARRPVSVSLSGPGTVEVVVGDTGEGEFRRIIVRDATEASTLTVRGAVEIDDILVLGRLKRITAPDVALRGRLDVQWVATIRLDAARDGHAITITANDGSISLRIAEMAGLNVVSAAPIKRLKTRTAHGANGTPQLIAPSVASLLIDGDLDLALEIAGAVARATIKGAVSGDWHAGSARSLTLGAIDPTFTAHFDGPVDRLNVRGSAAGRITALTLGRMTVRGDYDGRDAGAQLILMKPPDPAAPRDLTLGRLTVNGVLRRVEIHSRGHAGRISARIVEQSVIFAGVADDLPGLPASADDFVTAARLDGLKVTGRRDRPFWLVDSRIAAAEIGTVTIGFAQTGADDPFGVAGRSIRSLTYRDADTRLRARSAEDIDAAFPLGSFEVRVV